MAKNPMRKWGQLQEFQHWSRGLPDDAICRRLRITPRTLAGWRAEQRPVPFWCVELLRLWDMESIEMVRKMGLKGPGARLYLVPRAAA